MDNLNDISKEKMESAIKKIEALRQMKDSLAKHGKEGISQERIDSVVQMLSDIEMRSNNLLETAKDASRKIMQHSVRAGDSRGSSGLGSLIGTLGKCVTNGVSTIVNGAVPITKSVVNTSASLVNTASKAATSVADTIVKTGASVSSGIINGATEASQSLIGQTANMASKLTSSVTSTATGLFKTGSESANNLISSVLGNTQSSSSPIGSMVSNTASLSQNILSNASTLAGNITSNASALAGSIASSTASTVGSMVSSVSNFATGMIGGAAGSIIDSVFPGSGSSGGVSSMGGLFGDAISTAGNTVSSVANAASGIVSNLANGLVGGESGGLAGLASNLLGGASDIAGNLARAGMDAVGSLLGNATQAAGGLLDAAGSVAGNLLDTASNVASGLMDGIGNVASDAIGTAGDLVSDAIGAAGDMAGAVSDVAGDVLSSVGDMAGDIIDTAADMAESVVDGVADIAESVVDTAMDAVEDVVDAIDDAFSDIDEEAEDMDEEFDEEDWEDDWTDEEYEDEEFDEDEEDEEEEDWDEDDEEDDEDYDEDYDEEDEEEDEEDDQEDEEQESDDSSTTPMGNDSPNKDNGITTTEGKEKTFGWESRDANIPTGLDTMMHDGDQQFINPYGPTNGFWTMYSFRPSDVKKGWPQIAITPSSFEAIRSLDTMLDNIPWVVVKEYFFKNTASTMIDFVKKIMGMAKAAFESSKQHAEDHKNDTSAQTSADTKSSGSSLLDTVKEKFGDITLKEAAIDIPYILYAGLRTKQFGNTYIFPYIANNSTVINQSNNASEWGNGEGGGGLLDMLKSAIGSISNLVGGIASSLMGSQAQAANLFPAPSWSNNNKDKISFTFDLILINDNIVKARNNYMCVNTIIHNNRSIQKAILAFPGALYEIWLPTGQRHLMCTGDFKLYPLGLNRQTPVDFFEGSGQKGGGANFSIGVQMYGLNLQNPKDKGHRSEVEVIPDAYKLSITFTSCLANNMNTAVFQYYVQMTYYDGGNEKTDQDPGQEQQAKALEELEKQLVKKGVINGEPLQAPEPAPEGGGEGGGGEAPAPSGPVKSARSSNRIGGRQARDFTQEIMELVEKFDESTYNKKLGKLNTAVGDQTVNSDGVIATIRKTSGVIRESTEFLSRLYNAEDNKLWYREFEQDELYTTLKPDYRQILKKKYAELMKSMRKIQTDMDLLTSAIERNNAELRKTLDVSKRTPILERNVDLTRKVNELVSQKNDLADKIIRTDTDLVQSAFDEHDEVVSVKRRGVGIRMFKQVWNEKIMNSYEKDKLQYLTSEEKTRYFKEKIRELNKIDKHGVLNHPDWFFRVVVLDYIVQQMKKLVLWFKNCSWDDFETIYRIVRKLKMLHLDVDSIYFDDKFDINKTNLFYISDEEMSQFTKIDEILTGNTLYEIFSNQVRLNFTKTQNKVESSSKMTSDEMKEIMRERTTEEDIERRRTVRQQVVTRYWGSESALTKEAYDIANRGSSQEVEDDVDFDTIAALKNEIIQLKLTNSDDDALKEKLGQFTGYIRIIKESLVMKKMNEMNQLAGSQMEIKDGSVNAQVVKPE